MHDPLKPIATKDVRIPASLEKIVERLAAHIHEKWADFRKQAGWSFGNRRDEAEKKQPLLLPYAEIPESEKKIDRVIATETIKALLSLGYIIKPPPLIELNSSRIDTQEVEKTPLLQLAQDPGSLDLGSALELWRLSRLEKSSRSPRFFQTLSYQALRLGEPLLAFDIAVEGEKWWPNNVQLKQIIALSLLRSKATEPALTILKKLYDDGHRDEETLGLLGRSYKDLAAETAAEPQKHEYLSLAYTYYRSAFNATGGFWSGINAAALALYLGKNETAQELARNVRELCSQEMVWAISAGGDLYWPLSSMGEAFLIEEQVDEAEKWYTDAVSMAVSRYGDLNSTRKNARLILANLELNQEMKDRIDSCFIVPRIVVFEGLELTELESFLYLLTPEREIVLKDQFKNLIKNNDSRIGYSSAVSIFDLLFIESLLEQQGEVHLVLPYNIESFKTDLRKNQFTEKWFSRFIAVLEKATEIVSIFDREPGGTNTYLDYINLVTLGLGKIQARYLDSELIIFSVTQISENRISEEEDAARKKEIDDLQVIILPGDHAKIPKIADIMINQSSILPPGDRDKSGLGEPELSIKAMLFADTVSFSKLNDSQIPAFFKNLKSITDQLTSLGHEPLTTEAWGDGFYLIFSSVQEAGRYALDLCDIVNRHNREEKGIPGGIQLRVALHAAPVLKHVHPMTGLTNYTGTHVIRTARIEPITPPGKVYVSQEFAALAETEGAKDFTCDYVGLTPLAKDFGSTPMFSLRRKTDHN